MCRGDFHGPELQGMGGTCRSLLLGREDEAHSGQEALQPKREGRGQMLSAVLTYPHLLLPPGLYFWSPRALVSDGLHFTGEVCGLVYLFVSRSLLILKFINKCKLPFIFNHCNALLITK